MLLSRGEQYSIYNPLHSMIGGVIHSRATRAAHHHAKDRGRALPPTRQGSRFRPAGFLARVWWSLYSGHVGPDLSITSRHPEHVLADVREHEVVVDRGRLVEAALAELALDVVLLGVPVATVAVDAGVARLPRGLGAEILRHVGLAAARLARVEQRRRLVAHELGGVGRDVSAGDRELHALVGPDRPAED